MIQTGVTLGSTLCSHPLCGLCLLSFLDLPLNFGAPVIHLLTLALLSSPTCFSYPRVYESQPHPCQTGHSRVPGWSLIPNLVYQGQAGQAWSMALCLRRYLGSPSTHQEALRVLLPGIWFIRHKNLEDRILFHSPLNVFGFPRCLTPKGGAKKYHWMSELVNGKLSE